MNGDDIKQTALRVLAGEGSSCGCDAITASLYDATQMTEAEFTALLRSTGFPLE